MKVNPFLNRHDLEVLYAGASGRSTRFIQAQVGLSVGQVSYRLKKDGIRRAEARNGETEFSHQMYEAGRDLYLRLEMNRLRKKYKALPASDKPRQKGSNVPTGRKRRVYA